MSSTLAPSIHQGILNFPVTPEAKVVAEKFLEEDRKNNHCFFRRGFHNHLSHHILAAYDLGAPAGLLKAIYEREQEGLKPIDFNVDTGATEKQRIRITTENWQEFLGQDKHYAGILDFFSEQIQTIGTGKVLEQYVFSPSANDNDTLMLLRFVGGIVHPLIQTGYAVEFGSDAMVAQALAQAAVHSPMTPSAFDLADLYANGKGPKIQTQKKDSAHRQPSSGRSLLSIFRDGYDSQILHPVMPYNPDALIREREHNALKDGRAEEIRRLCALWQVDTSFGQKELDSKIEEILWFTTLLLTSSGKPGRKPRLDFFLMHLLNASIFLPSLLNAIPSIQSKAMLLRAYVPMMLVTMLTRGRPRIDADLVMAWSDVPRPPTTSSDPTPDNSAIGSLSQDETYNPWPTIISSVLYAPDAHTLKAIRSLYYAAQHYGTTAAGDVIGAFDEDGRETIKGISKVDGTVFVRAAGMIMDNLGWVSHGQQEGTWDRSALGWDEAWKDGK